MDLSALYLHDPAPAIQRLCCLGGLDTVMASLSVAGEGWALALLALGISRSTGRSWRDAFRSALRCALILAAVGALVAATKHAVGAPRPLQLLGPERVRVLLEPLRHMSFPSGHSASAAALAVWSRFEARRAWRWALLFALLCGFSRVYVGAHWVTDVLAGWLLGGTVAAAACLAWPAPRCATGPAGAALAAGRDATPGT